MPECSTGEEVYSIAILMRDQSPPHYRLGPLFQSGHLIL